MTLRSSLVNISVLILNTMKHFFNMNIKPIKSNVQQVPTVLFDDVGEHGHC